LLRGVDQVRPALTEMATLRPIITYTGEPNCAIVNAAPAPDESTPTAWSPLTPPTTRTTPLTPPTS
jgi:hypothetical protein